MISRTMIGKTKSAVSMLTLLSLIACGGSNPPTAEQRAALAQPLFETEYKIIDRRPDFKVSSKVNVGQADKPLANPNRNAYFGDLHVHTKYSFDAYAFGTLASPYDAYRFAKGEAIKHPAGFEIKLQAPLDFYGVTDHGFFMGVSPVAADTSTEFSKHSFAKVVHDLNAPDNMDRWSTLDRMRSFGLARALALAIVEGKVSSEEPLAITRNAWADSINAADEHNNPGHFTTFVAYEYSTTADDNGSLHRNVIFESSDRVDRKSVV